MEERKSCGLLRYALVQRNELLSGRVVGGFGFPRVQVRDTYLTQTNFIPDSLLGIAVLEQVLNDVLPFHAAEYIGVPILAQEANRLLCVRQ